MSFDRQPTLKGMLVELRPLRPEDYGELYAVAADPLIWRQHPARKRHEEAVFREFFTEALASGGALLATDAETARVIGSSRFHGYSEERSWPGPTGEAGTTASSSSSCSVTPSDSWTPSSSSSARRT